ncbi:MAG: hypothetical protein OHK0056_05530 [Bacteriovoracaceae bacterium]
MNEKTINSSIYFLLSIIAFILFGFSTFGINFNLVAESIGIFSILRVIDGLPHISSLGEIPSHTSPYGAYFYIVIGKIFGIFNVKNLTVITLICRFISIGFLLGIIRNAKEESDQDKSWQIAYFTLFALAFPFMTIMIRSDWPAYFFEFLALTILFKIPQQNFDIKKIIISGLLFSLAINFKLNSVGILTGCCIFYLWTKDFKKLFLLSSSFAIFTLLFLALTYQHLGKNYLLHVLHTANYGLVPLSQWPGLIEKVFINTIYRPLFLWILIFTGFILEKNLRKQFSMIVFAILTNFIIASVFQIKIGAAENYYLPSFLCSIFLFKRGWLWFKTSTLSSNLEKKILKNLFSFSLILGIINFTTSTVPFLANQTINYPYSQLIKFLDENASGKKVYTSDANLSVVLYPRVVLGPWDERGYLNSRYLKSNHAVEINEKLKNIDFAAYVTSGSNCDKTPPSSELLEIKTSNDLLLNKFKNICVWSKKNE